MWQFDWAGVQVRYDDLTLAQIEQLERHTGTPFYELLPWTSTAHARLLVETVCPHLDWRDIPLKAFTQAVDDLPTMFEDGMPTKGGRPWDVWVLIAWRRGFTPQQIREEFTLRDLELIMHASS